MNLLLILGSVSVLLWLVVIFLLVKDFKPKKIDREKCTVTLEYEFMNGLKSKCEVVYDSRIKSEDISSVIDAYESAMSELDNKFN